MVLGSAAAGLWLVSGGSFLMAIAIYSLVATAFTLGAALLSFWLAERKPHEACATTETLRPAE